MSLENHLTSLRAKHQELEDAVAALEGSPSADSLEITQLKKQKLQLKEQISEIEAEATVH